MWRDLRNIYIYIYTTNFNVITITNIDHCVSLFFIVCHFLLWFLNKYEPVSNMSAQYEPLLNVIDHYYLLLIIIKFLRIINHYWLPIINHYQPFIVVYYAILLRSP